MPGGKLREKGGRKGERWKNGKEKGKKICRIGKFSPPLGTVKRKQKPRNQPKAMSEKELNAYRFTSGQEPSDEMLAQIMKEAAEEAAEKHRKVLKAYFAAMLEDIATLRSTWAQRIKSVAHE